ncbi:hypothetical protein GJ744_002957 [Endocarpon pusillum]|uniref:AGC-kinase C-terminal domain-containing protein n=1 Tax=Endocarpon pusillum TaxID=364733 RepID=A0A8H7E0W6_9EURO|nr:hypothetical protein GJ744_002957 [Endocarpon pusillum]
MLSKLRGNHHGSYSTPHPDDHTSLPPLYTWVDPTKFDRPSSPAASRNLFPGFSFSDVSESPTDEAPAFRMTALPRSSDEWHHYRPTSAASERAASTTSGTLSSVASRAHNFVFSLQPPKKFTASLTPNESSTMSLNAGQAHLYGDRPHPKNVSASSLSIAEDNASHKSGSKQGRGKLYLLNPLNLLARRRTSQNQLPRAEDVNPIVHTPNVPHLPVDYDPRIRGKIVHDFSVPKASRLNSYTGVSSAETSPSIESCPSTRCNRRTSDQLPPFAAMASRTPQSPTHSPIFKEHFDDDRRPLQQHNTSYLHTLASSPTIKATSDPPRLPAFAKSLPLDIFGNVKNTDRATAPALAESNFLSRKIDALPQPNLDSLEKRNSSQAPGTPVSAVATEKQVAPANDFLRPAENLPKHMSSTSSRFSFQLGGVDSEVQERLLEEKHKEHAASKLSLAKNEQDVDSDEERYVDDDFDDDDGLEEKIPGINADSDEEPEGHPSQLDNYTDIAIGYGDGLEESIPGVNVEFDGEGQYGLQHQSVDYFHFTPLPERLSPNPHTNTSQTTPRDGDGEVIGRASTKISPDPSFAPQGLEFSPKVLEQPPWLSGLGIIPLSDSESPNLTSPAHQFPPQAPEPQEEPDDLYFDDGHIGSPASASDGETFDEDIFDDESGKIHDISTPNAQKLEVARQQNSVPLQAPEDVPQWTYAVDPGGSNPQSTLSIAATSEALGECFVRRDQQAQADVQGHAQASNGLTEDNLAYQNALVSAATQAASQGRFSRHLSTSQHSEDLNSRSQVADSQPGLISDDSRLSRLLDNAGAEDESDEFPFDDSLEDDPMIAEANAEVLENDDDGFYGQEFGFYARVYGKGNSEKVNGGFFGPRGAEGVHRSHSAKANFQEPSLTPITERSEWSHRNSFVSINPLGMPSAGPAVPGVSHLLDLDPDEMSLSALMKLRRGAWGGSQTSLNSSSGSQAGNSPLAYPPLKDSFGQPPAALDNGRINRNDCTGHPHSSAAMLPEVFEEDRTRQSSNATEMQKAPWKMPSDVGLQGTLQDNYLHLKALSQTTQAAEKPGKSHSRASSGAESVSYVKDPEGSGRWLFERRRTGDDGEIELIEREYVPGARI